MVPASESGWHGAAPEGLPQLQVAGLGHAAGRTRQAAQEEGGGSMTDEQLDELERLEQAATPGEWAEGRYRLDAAVWRVSARNDWLCAMAGPDGFAKERGKKDAAFIAAARNALQELIKDLREARAEAKSWREMCNRMSTSGVGTPEARAEVARLRSLQTTDGTPLTYGGGGTVLEADLADPRTIKEMADRRRKWLDDGPALAPDAQPDDAVLP
jgi:hypothetical protein